MQHVWLLIECVAGVLEQALRESSCQGRLKGQPVYYEGGYDVNQVLVARANRSGSHTTFDGARGADLFSQCSTPRGFSELSWFSC